MFPINSITEEKSIAQIDRLEQKYWLCLHIYEHLVLAFKVILIQVSLVLDYPINVHVIKDNLLVYRLISFKYIYSFCLQHKETLLQCQRDGLWLWGVF